MPVPVSQIARSRTRRLLTATLRCIPDATFAPLRSSFAASKPGSAAHRTQQALLKAARYRGVPPDVDSFVLSDNRLIRIANADSFIVEWLYWFGERNGYEPATVRWWKEFCASSSQIVELGSNIGYFVVQGASVAPAARYTAVEPHPRCAALCRRNVELNGITNATVIEAAAVADASTSSVELLLPGGRDHYEEAPCTGFVGVNDVHRSAVDRSCYASITVPAVAATELLDPSTDLVKMDVEGQEHALLEALTDRLKETRPTIFVELLDTTPHLRALILDELLPAGYRCFVPTSTALVPLSAAELATVALDREYGSRDIILTASATVTRAGP